MLATLVSLLSFAGVMQAGPWRVPVDGGMAVRPAALLGIRLVDSADVERPPEPAVDPSPVSAPVAVHETVDKPGVAETSGDAVLAYVPVTELSERPLLIRDIDGELDLASAGIADADMRTTQQATATLLINEHGGVDRVQFESEVLPRYLEAILARRFADARFLPGKINGRPVPSALRIALQWQ